MKMDRRQFLTWIGGVGTLAAVGGGGVALQRKLSSLTAAVSSDPTKVLISSSATSLIHFDPTQGFHPKISLLGLEDKTGQAHFHAFLFSSTGELLDVHSTRLARMENQVLISDKAPWSSALVLIEAPESHGLASNPESAALVHHRSPWGEDGHHLGQWLSKYGGLGFLPLIGRDQSLMAGGNLSEEHLKGQMKITDQNAKVVFKEDNFEFPAYSTRYFHVGDDSLGAPGSIQLPASKQPNGYLFEFTDAKRGTITWNAWRWSKGSFTAFHGVHTPSRGEGRTPKFQSDLGEPSFRFMKRHWLYPVDLVAFSSLPNGEKAKSYFFIPNTTQTSVTPHLFLVNNEAKVCGKLKQPKEIPVSGSLCVEVDPKHFEMTNEIGSYGYAMVHMGADGSPQSLGKVLITQADPEVSFMQHFRPLEIYNIAELKQAEEKLNGGILTDYYVATPTESLESILVRNYSSKECTDSELIGRDEKGELKTVKLPHIPAGGLLAVSPKEFGFSEKAHGFRLTAPKAALKISVLQKGPQGNFSVSHGTHRIKVLEKMDPAVFPVLARIGDRSDV